MKVSGFTIARNIAKYNYPAQEAILSILPLCDEFIVNVGDSDDNTLDILKGVKSDKIKFIHNTWDLSQGKEVLSHQTNLALKECKGDWAFYLQLDEVVHERDFNKIKTSMQKYLDDPEVDALRFSWFHFYGSYYRYRVDSGWYQKQDRIIRNNGTIESFGDAYAFRRKDGKELRRRNSRGYIYHYGWVQPSEVMAQRRINAERIGFVSLDQKERQNEYEYGDLARFPAYYASHPKVMQKRIQEHSMSQDDWRRIEAAQWWFPPKIFKLRYKTGIRVRKKL